MSSSIQAPEAPTPSVVLSAAVARRLESWARKILFSRLCRLKRGQIVIQEGAEPLTFGIAGGKDPLSAVLSVHSPRFYPSVLLGEASGRGNPTWPGTGPVIT